MKRYTEAMQERFNLRSKQTDDGREGPAAPPSPDRARLDECTRRIRQFGLQIATADDQESERILWELTSLVAQRKELRERITSAKAASPQFGNTSNAISAPAAEHPNTSSESDALSEVQKEFGTGPLYYGVPQPTNWSLAGREYTGGWTITKAERLRNGELFVSIRNKEGEEERSVSLDSLSQTNPNTVFTKDELAIEKLGDQTEVSGYKIGEYVVQKKDAAYFVGGSGMKIAHFSADGRFAYLGPHGFEGLYQKATIDDIKSMNPKVGDRVRLFRGAIEMTKEPVEVSKIKDNGEKFPLFINDTWGVGRDSILVL